MKKNIGAKDRLIRLILACVLLGLAWYFYSLILLAASLFVFFEVVAGWCIVYQILGQNSCPLNYDK